MRRLTMLVAAMLVCSETRAANPETELRDAVERLVNLSSYRWERWTELPSREELDAAREGGDPGVGLPVGQVVSGKTDRDDFSIWMAVVQTNELQGVSHGRGGVVNYGEGWKTWDDLARELESIQRRRDPTTEPKRPAWVPGSAILLSRGFLSPSGQLRYLLWADLAGCFRVGDTIRVQFSPDGVRKILLLESAESAQPSIVTAEEKAEGWAKLSLKDGQIARCEVHIEGLIIMRGFRH